jgi:outer membrane protein
MNVPIIFTFLQQYFHAANFRVSLLGSRFIPSVRLLALPFCIAIFSACQPAAKESKPVVFMDSFKLFEGFEMKKDYDQMLEQQLVAEKHILDSLQVNGSNPELLARANAEFDEKFGQLSEKYTQEVYARLNMYIQEFGRQHQYGLIVGSGGQGNVMYVDKQSDITRELLLFVNKQYARR